MTSRMQLYASGCICALLLLVNCKADQVLILVADRPPKLRHRPFRSVSSMGGTQDSCSDAVEISDRSGVQFSQRYRHMPRPWTRNDIKAKLYKSNILYYNWLWMKSLRVKGLADITVDDVLSKLESSGCMFLAWGDAVRDAILGRNPINIDGEVTCTAQEVRDICVRTFGRPNCGTPPHDNFTRTVIGNPNSPIRRNELMADPIDVIQWNSTFRVPPTMWEYTANSIGLYDDQKGNVYLFDLTGRGVKDVCARWIDITTDKDQWDSWADGDLNKLLRYYKLRLYGFRAVNDDVREFIVSRIKHFFTVMKMQQFYCKHVVDGTFVWRERDARRVASESEHFTSTCLIAPFNVNTNLDMKTIDDILKADFGEFYEEKIRYAISSMEIRVLAADQSDVRRKQPEKTQIQIATEEERKNDRARDEARDEERGTRGLFFEVTNLSNIFHENGTFGTSSSETVDYHPTTTATTIESKSFTLIASERLSIFPAHSSESRLEKDTRELPFRIIEGVDKGNMSSEGKAVMRKVVEAKIVDKNKQEAVKDFTNGTRSLSAAFTYALFLMMTMFVVRGVR